MFTAQELEELRQADAEIDRDFSMTMEEIRSSRERDKKCLLSRKDNRGRRIAEYQRAYYEANREKIAESQRAYREANREKIAESKRDLLTGHRKSLGLTQKQYAALLGISQPTVCLWERGFTPPNLAILEAVFPDLAAQIRTCR